MAWMKWYLSNFSSTPLTCDLALFPDKNIKILQKLIVFFLAIEEEIKISFRHIWISQWLMFFHTTAYFFRF